MLLGLLLYPLFHLKTASVNQEQPLQNASRKDDTRNETEQADGMVLINHFTVESGLFVTQGTEKNPTNMPE